MAFATAKKTCPPSFALTEARSGGWKASFTERETVQQFIYLTGVELGFQTVFSIARGVDLHSSGLTDLKSGGVTAFATGKATYQPSFDPTAKSGGSTASATSRKLTLIRSTWSQE